MAYCIPVLQCQEYSQFNYVAMVILSISILICISKNSFIFKGVTPKNDWTIRVWNSNKCDKSSCLLSSCLTWSTANARPLLVSLRGLMTRKEGRMGVGRYKRGRKGYGTQGEYNPPLPPYQLNPNSHPPLLYSRRGCWIHTATPFSTRCAGAARNWALALSFGFSAPNPPPHSHLQTRCLWLPPLPPYITHHHCLTQQTRNQAIVAWLRVLASTPSLHSCLQTQMSVTTATSNETRYHPLPPPSITVWHGRPGTEPQWLGFGFRSTTSSPALHLRQ